MTRAKQIVRALLLIHGLLNIAQGLFSVFRPTAYAETAGKGFIGAPNKAIQSIGLGCLGVGALGTYGAISNARGFYITTLLIRVAFASIVLGQWGWDDGAAVFVYEASVAIIAALGVVL